MQGKIAVERKALLLQLLFLLLGTMGKTITPGYAMDSFFFIGFVRNSGKLYG